jgi:hypothetical protein
LRSFTHIQSLPNDFITNLLECARVRKAIV